MGWVTRGEERRSTSNSSSSRAGPFARCDRPTAARSAWIAKSSDEENPASAGHAEVAPVVL
jgi:hypothetical protein